MYFILFQLLLLALCCPLVKMWHVQCAWDGQVDDKFDNDLINLKRIESNRSEGC